MGDGVCERGDLTSCAHECSISWAQFWIKPGTNVHFDSRTTWSRPKVTATVTSLLLLTHVMLQTRSHFNVCLHRLRHAHSHVSAGTWRVCFFNRTHVKPSWFPLKAHIFYLCAVNKANNSHSSADFSHFSSLIMEQASVATCVCYRYKYTYLCQEITSVISNQLHHPVQWKITTDIMHQRNRLGIFEEKCTQLLPCCKTYSR